MWGFAVSWWVFVSNFVFWTVGWTRDGGGRRHAGLRHTVINIFHHFWPFIDWTTNQYIMKVIIRLIDNSSRCCHRRFSCWGRTDSCAAPLFTLFESAECWMRLGLFVYIWFSLSCTAQEFTPGCLLGLRGGRWSWGFQTGADVTPDVHCV